jgi:nucleoside-diphosphate-sugar epimerase
MHVFVTGASGFVGSAIVKELLRAGHTVLGLARTDSAAKALTDAGAQVHRGDIYDLESIKAGALACDAVIHTAFNHDFSKYKENCETDRGVILALGSVLAGSRKPLVVTSGIGLLRLNRPVVESDLTLSSEVIPRAASEEAARAVAAQGVKAYIVRLPPTVHGRGDHGFIPMIIDMSKEKGESVYIGEGHNRWPAVHRFDAAVLYRLIIEKLPDQQVLHAVAEQGIPFREIAEAIGKGLRLPVVSKTAEDAAKHFTWFTHFASLDCPASSELTSATLGWQPKEISLAEDMQTGGYF